MAVLHQSDGEGNSYTVAPIIMKPIWTVGIIEACKLHNCSSSPTFYRNIFLFSNFGSICNLPLLRLHNIESVLTYEFDLYMDQILRSKDSTVIKRGLFCFKIFKGMGTFYKISLKSVVMKNALCKLCLRLTQWFWGFKNTFSTVSLISPHFIWKIQSLLPKDTLYKV